MQIDRNITLEQLIGHRKNSNQIYKMSSGIFSKIVRGNRYVYPKYCNLSDYSADAITKFRMLKLKLLYHNEFTRIHEPLRTFIDTNYYNIIRRLPILRSSWNIKVCSECVGSGIFVSKRFRDFSFNIYCDLCSADGCINEMAARDYLASDDCRDMALDGI